MELRVSNMDYAACQFTFWLYMFQYFFKEFILTAVWSTDSFTLFPRNYTRPSLTITLDGNFTGNIQVVAKMYDSSSVAVHNKTSSTTVFSFF